MHEIRPLGALVRGVLAGAAGSALQTQFFKRTARITPAPPPEAFQPPEPQQAGEMSVETVARRLVEGFMQRGPLTDEQKQKGGNLVHYAFGSAWGGLYGLARESFRPIGTPLGTAAFSTGVWYASDNVILPAFKLAAWPQAYPAKSHAYAWLAHLAYGAGLWAAYSAERQDLAALALGVWAARSRRKAPFALAALLARSKRKAPSAFGAWAARKRKAPSAFGALVAGSKGTARSARIAAGRAAFSWLGDTIVVPLARGAAARA